MKMTAMNALKVGCVVALTQSPCVLGLEAGAEKEPFRFRYPPVRERDKVIKELDDADALSEQWTRLPHKQRTARWAKALRSQAVERYETLIASYPGTEFAAMALMNIMTLHTSSDDMGRTAATYKRIIDSFPQTRYEMDAHMHMGLTYLQKLKQPSRAAGYFDKIPDPRENRYQFVRPGGAVREKDSNTVTEAESYYVNARLHLAKSYLLLRQFESVKQEIEYLRDRYPETREWVETTVQAFHVDVFGIPREGIYEPIELNEDFLFGTAESGHTELAHTKTSGGQTNIVPDGSTEKDDLRPRLAKKVVLSERVDMRTSGASVPMWSTSVLWYGIMGVAFVGAGILEMARRRR